MGIRERNTAVRNRRQSAGQSVAEFAIILPIMLALFGGAVDFSRVFLADLQVQSATRNAAEFVATDVFILNETDAQTKAQQLVCLEIVGTPTCTGANDPKAVVAPGDFVRCTTCPGASAQKPIATVKVTVTRPFKMLFPYPLLPEGQWTLTAAFTFSVVRAS